VSANVCIYSKERTFDGINMNNTLLYDFKDKYEGHYVRNTISNKCYYVVKIKYNNGDCFIKKQYNPDHGGNIAYLLEYNINDDFFDIMMIECFNNVGIADEKCFIVTLDELSDYEIILESDLINYVQPIKKCKIKNVSTSNVDEVGWLPTVINSRSSVIEEFDYCVDSVQELIKLWDIDYYKFNKDCSLSNYLMHEFIRMNNTNSFHIRDMLLTNLPFYSRNEIINLFTNVWPFILSQDNIERLNGLKKRNAVAFWGAKLLMEKRDWNV
jgi:hypothetical protein